MTALATSVPVGVVGAGTMGAGIAEVAASAGHRVLLYDGMSGAVEAALERIGAALERAEAQGRITANQRASTFARITACPRFRCARRRGPRDRGDRRGPRQPSGSCFETLEVFLEPDAILASNTSSLSITALGQACSSPERVVGMHFFNPAPRMALVEVVRGLATRPRRSRPRLATAERLGQDRGRRCARRRASSSTGWRGRSTARRCGRWPRAPPTPRRSTPSCARPAAFAWGRSSSWT